MILLTSTRFWHPIEQDRNRHNMQKWNQLSLHRTEIIVVFKIIYSIGSPFVFFQASVWYDSSSFNANNCCITDSNKYLLNEMMIKWWSTHTWFRVSAIETFLQGFQDCTISKFTVFNKLNWKTFLFFQNLITWFVRNWMLWKNGYCKW